MTALSHEVNEVKADSNGRTLEGVVVSDKMDKGIVVKVEYYKADSRVGKFVRTFKKFHAHDEINVSKMGDKVRIRECRPYSKTKSFVLVSVLEKSQ